MRPRSAGHGATAVTAVRNISNMAENLVSTAAVVTEKTCAICLEDSKNPLDLPCGHSFCDGCLDEWRSRYGVDEEMRRKCPICRAMIPPSKEMVASLFTYRATKKELEDKNETSSERYHETCRLLAHYEERVGKDWDGVTVLQDNNDKPTAVAMPDYILQALRTGDIKSVLRWIDADRTEDRVNAISSAEWGSTPALSIACATGHSTLVTLLLQLGADAQSRDCQGNTAIGMMFNSDMFARGDPNKMIRLARLLLSWGASFFPNKVHRGTSKEYCISRAREYGRPELANLLESEFGGRRCEIVNLSSQPELNGKTCVADECILDTSQYRVTLETKSKEVLVLGPYNLKRRDRTPHDCGYYIEFKNGRTIRHDFDSSEDCQAFVAAMSDGETRPAVTEEAEARAEQAAAELLAELGLDDSPNNVPTSSTGQVKDSKKKRKKKGGKKKK